MKTSDMVNFAIETIKNNAITRVYQYAIANRKNELTVDEVVTLISLVGKDSECQNTELQSKDSTVDLTKY